MSSHADDDDDDDEDNDNDDDNRSLWDNQNVNRIPDCQLGRPLTKQSPLGICKNPNKCDLKSAPCSMTAASLVVEERSWCRPDSVELNFMMSWRYSRAVTNSRKNAA